MSVQKWALLIIESLMWWRHNEESYVCYLFMLWHMRGMSLARNMRESQCGVSLLVMPHT